jgi:hypothetical protein
MAEFVFTSPGVKFKERDLSFVTRNVGITTLGLVGETLKGPAFEPIFIQDQTEFLNRFGGQSTERFLDSQKSLKYQLPYVANAYLEESNQLYVTRVLGLSGYDAGTAWAITLSAGVDPETVGVDTSVPPVINTGVVFTGGAYLGVSLTATGQTGSTFSGLTKAAYPSTDFSGYLHEFVVTSISSTGGTVTDTVTLYSGVSLTEFEGMVLAVIRSRGTTIDHVNSPSTTTFDTLSLTMTGNSTIIGAGDLFGQFNLVAVPTNTGATNGLYTASLNPNSSSFLPNVVGNKPKDKNTLIWVEATYPDLIKYLDAMGYGYGVNTILLNCNTTPFTLYKTTGAAFRTPETPWIVSQIKGSSVDRLFKFVSISDGDSANQEIKISITNINPTTLEFDVVIRDFNDSDDNTTILETFSRCSMIKGNTNYIAQRIGTTDGEYDLQSKYVMVEMADDIELDVFPAGFEGYSFKDFTAFGGIKPQINYKTRYQDSERKKKVYLGISEKGYSTYDTDGLEVLQGTGINQNFFNFFGYSGFENTKGFHMDVDATGITSGGFSFEVGAGKFQTINDVVDPTDTYYELISRKFTFVPAGGFDGWDVNRIVRSFGDNFRKNGIYDGVDPNGNPMNDFQAWLTAAHTYDNPEEVTINLFATPGINWSDNAVLVKDVIEIMETQRTDTLYVIDSPDITMSQVIGEEKVDVIVANDIADLLDSTEIDSSYACTYYPWIQMRDTQNNVNVYIPPTGEVVKAMAYTDNTKFPWFAPAGLQRGVTDARKSKYKLSLEARDTLYAARINPMADFADAGTAIFGQKTLQKKESALDRINVRRLLLQIKVLIANIAIRLVFEQNDQATIDQFLQKATPILDNIKRERGLTEFRIKMDDSNNTPETRDRNELYGEIFLKPTRAVEFIGITFTITPSGASFADVGA